MAHILIEFSNEIIFYNKYRFNIIHFESVNFVWIEFIKWSIQCMIDWLTVFISGDFSTLYSIFSANWFPFSTASKNSDVGNITLDNACFIIAMSMFLFSPKVAKSALPSSSSLLFWSYINYYLHLPHLLTFPVIRLNHGCRDFHHNPHLPHPIQL